MRPYFPHATASFCRRGQFLICLCVCVTLTKRSTQGPKDEQRSRRRTPGGSAQRDYSNTRVKGQQGQRCRGNGINGMGGEGGPGGGGGGGSGGGGGWRVLAGGGASGRVDGVGGGCRRLLSLGAEGRASTRLLRPCMCAETCNSGLPTPIATTAAPARVDPPGPGRRHVGPDHRLMW